MNLYIVDYVTVNMVHITSMERAQTTETARQAFAQRQMELGDTAAAVHPASPIVIREYKG